MTAQEIFRAIDEGMAEIAGKLASGELMALAATGPMKSCRLAW